MERFDIKSLAWLGSMGLFIWLASDSITPFLVGGLLACAALPLSDFFERKGFSRSLSSGVSVAACFIVMIIVTLSILPVALMEVKTIIARLPEMQLWFKNTLLPWLNSHHLQIKMDDIVDKLGESSGAYAQKGLSILGTGGASIMSVLSTLLISPIAAAYILGDRERISQYLKSMVPLNRQDVYQRMTDHSIAAISTWMRGQLKVCASISVTCAAGFWIIGLPGWFGLSIVAGALCAIPFIGFAVAAILCLVAAALAGQGVFIGAIIVLTVVQVLESFVFTPKFVGEELGLHPLGALFSMMFLGQYLGFFGVLLALPITSTIQAVFDEIRTSQKQ